MNEKKPTDEALGTECDSMREELEAADREAAPLFHQQMTELAAEEDLAELWELAGGGKVEPLPGAQERLRQKLIEAGVLQPEDSPPNENND